MSRGQCSPESQAACPLMRCLGTDLHHLYYDRADYKTRTEKNFRTLPDAKYVGERCVHNAIHGSGYKPEKPTLEQMRDAIENNGADFITEERNRQLSIGRLTFGCTFGPEAA